jgi:hypothetical protein
MLGILNRSLKFKIKVTIILVSMNFYSMDEQYVILYLHDMKKNKKFPFHSYCFIKCASSPFASWRKWSLRKLLKSPGFLHFRQSNFAHRDRLIENQPLENIYQVLSERCPVTMMKLQARCPHSSMSVSPVPRQF